MGYRPKLRQLQYFCALADCCHFGQAAKVCNVSQSTLSSGIHELEQALGVVLFERNPKGVLLTPIGIKTRLHAKTILSEIDDLVTYCDSTSGTFNAPIRLGVIPTIAPFLLPSLLKSMRLEHPDTRLLIREDMSDHLIELLQQGELDVLLLALPWKTDHLELLELFDDELLFTCPAEADIADQTSLTIDDVKDSDFLLLEDGHCLRDHILASCQFSLSDLTIPYQATSLNTIVQMVANGIGNTLLPEMAVNSNLMHDADVVTKPFTDLHPTRTIALAWRSKCPRAQEFALLGKYIRR